MWGAPPSWDPFDSRNAKKFITYQTELYRSVETGLYKDPVYKERVPQIVESRGVQQDEYLYVLRQQNFLRLGQSTQSDGLSDAACSVILYLYLNKN